MATRVEETVAPGDLEKQTDAAFSAAPAVISPARSNEAADEQPETSNVHSEKFQLGVQRVRAITETWSPKTLWLMLSLYVPWHPHLVSRSLANAASTLSRSST
jgi:hypothetical protein